jgi:hypothetical protein
MMFHSASVSRAPVPASGAVLRRCACGGKAGPGGECAECRKKRLHAVRHKRRVKRPGDTHEQEANRLADRVSRGTSLAGDRPLPVLPLVQRAGGVGAGSALPEVHGALRSPGRPLDPSTRAFMEQRFGHDFSRVRVHTGTRAAAGADALQARAYTLGRDIVFAAGAYRPETPEGLRLLAHELVHTLQQGTAPGAGLVQRQEAGTCPSDADARAYLRTFEVSAHVEQEMDQQMTLASARAAGRTTAVTPSMIAQADQAIRAEFGSLLPGGRSYTAPESVTTHTPAQFANVRVPSIAAAHQRVGQAAVQYAGEDLEIACANRPDHPALQAVVVEPLIRRRGIDFVRAYEGARFGGQTRFPQVQGQTRPHVDLPARSRNMGHIVVHEALHFYVSDGYRRAAEAAGNAQQRALMEGGAEFLARHVIHQQLGRDQDFEINYSTYAPEFVVARDLAVHRGGLSSFALAYFQGRVDILGLPVQPKLRDSRRGDAYEREADRVAAQVTGSAQALGYPPVSVTHLLPATIQRQRSGERAGEGTVPTGAGAEKVWYVLPPPKAICQGDALYCWAAGGASWLRATGINPEATRDALIIRFGACMDEHGAIAEADIDDIFGELGARITPFSGNFDYAFVRAELERSGHFLLLIGGSFTGHTLVVYGVGVDPDGKSSRNYFSVFDPASCTHENRSFKSVLAVYIGRRAMPGPVAPCRKP